jgi:hypothetical protein
MDNKPRHRSGYTPADTDLVRSACLTVAVALGDYLDDLVIVGGIVPALLIDTERDPSEADLHPGTNDLDLGLSVAALDQQRYANISDHLRGEGFRPDTSDKGNPTVQRWQRDGLKLDFLIAPTPGRAAGRIHNLEADFGAIVTPGLELAFAERVLVRLDGDTLTGERAMREVPVCGPGAFVVLKAFAFKSRAEPKDAYDLVYVLRHTGPSIVADQLRTHATTHSTHVDNAIRALANDFATTDHIGPCRAADFDHHPDPDTYEAAIADAHGYVDDLINAYRA